MSAFRQAAAKLDLRRQPRERVSRRAKAVCGGRVQDCMIKDIAASGAGLYSRDALPDAFVLVDLEQGMAYEARLVWRRDTEAGVSLSRSQNLRGLVPAQYLAAKQIWQAAVR